VPAPPVPDTFPAEAFQHFGEVEIGPGRELRMAPRSQDGGVAWSTMLEAVA
jgi:alkaline phosphatase D